MSKSKSIQWGAPRLYELGRIGAGDDWTKWDSPFPFDILNTEPFSSPTTGMPQSTPQANSAMCPQGTSGVDPRPGPPISSAAPAPKSAVCPQERPEKAICQMPNMGLAQPPNPCAIPQDRAGAGMDLYFRYACQVHNVTPPIGFPFSQCRGLSNAKNSGTDQPISCATSK